MQHGDRIVLADWGRLLANTGYAPALRFIASHNSRDTHVLWAGFPFALPASCFPASFSDSAASSTPNGTTNCRAIHQNSPNGASNCTVPPAASAIRDTSKPPDNSVPTTSRMPHRAHISQRVCARKAGLCQVS